MPKGCYDRSKMKTVGSPVQTAKAITETPEQAAERITETFDVLSELTDLCLTGEARALIVSGDPGLGKSFDVERKLAKYDPKSEKTESVRGTVRATGLFKTLYDNRFPGNVVVLDDADSVWSDEEALNLLKAACDTTEKRVLSWKSEYIMASDKTGENVPKSFEFQGSVIFITNLDFDALIEKGNKLAPHLQAMISRAHFVDMGLRTKRDKLIRIGQVLRQGLLKHLKREQIVEVAKFINDNQDSMRELSLRAAIKLGHLASKGGNWQRTAKITMCRHG